MLSTIDPLTAVNAVVWLVLITVLGIRSVMFSIMLLLSIAWTAESLIDYGIIPDNVPDLIFIYIILLLFTKVFFFDKGSIRNLHLPGFIHFVGFLSIAGISAILNEISLLRFLLFIRHIVIFYLLFLGIVNSRVLISEALKLNKYLFFIFVLQVVVATGKWLIFPHVTGEFGQESLTGTYATHGGGFHAILPLIAMAFLIPAYVSTNKGFYLGVFWSFVWFSLVGSKRATIFVMPFMALYLFWIMKARFKVSKRVGRLLIAGGCVVLTIFLVVTLNNTLNPQNDIGGEFDLEYVLNYAANYTKTYTVIDGRTYAGGRLAATETMMGFLWEGDWQTFFFGLGPGIALRTGLVENMFLSTFMDLGIEDGITGLVWMSAQMGLLGCLAFILFLLHLYRMVLKAYHETDNEYWKIFHVGTLGTFLVLAFDFLAYSDAFITSETLLVTIYYFISMSLLSRGFQQAPEPNLHHVMPGQPRPLLGKAS